MVSTREDVEKEIPTHCCYNHKEIHVQRVNELKSGLRKSFLSPGTIKQKVYSNMLEHLGSVLQLRQLRNSFPISPRVSGNRNGNQNHFYINYHKVVFPLSWSYGSDSSRVLTVVNPHNQIKSDVLAKYHQQKSFKTIQDAISTVLTIYSLECLH